MYRNVVSCVPFFVQLDDDKKEVKPSQTTKSPKTGKKLGKDGFLLGFCETAPIATITCLARAMMDSIELHWNVLAFCFESILSYFPVIPCCK